MRRIINEDDILHLDSVIVQDNKYKDMTVREAICENRDCIMYLLKKGFYFDDEVLDYVNVKKIIKDIYYEVDFNGVIVYSTLWPEEMLEHKKVEEVKISHDGVRDESFYQV